MAHPGGRPSIYTPHLVERILLRMYAGESLRSICRDDDMPSRPTVHLWRIKHERFSVQYASARRAQVEARIEDVAELLSNPPMCQVPGPDGGVSERVDMGAVQLLRARADLAKWEASKLLRGLNLNTEAPLDYSERQDVQLSGELAIKRVIADL